jgi:hypothetical protein
MGQVGEAGAEVWTIQLSLNPGLIDQLRKFAGWEEGLVSAGRELVALLLARRM